MALYQGDVKGGSRSTAAPVLGTGANLKIDKVQVEPLLKALEDTDRVSATPLPNQLTSRGKSQKELVGALNGKGSLALQNGVVKGIDLVGLVKNAAASAVGGNGGETAFTSATGTYHRTVFSATRISTSGADTVGHRGRYRQPAPAHRRLQTVDQGGVHGGGAGQRKGPWDNISWGVDLAGMALRTSPTPESSLAAVPKAPATH